MIFKDFAYLRVSIGPMAKILWPNARRVSLDAIRVCQPDRFGMQIRRNLAC